METDVAKDRVLILGGARSGKSRFAQELATRLGQTVLFVATAEARDADMRRRIEAHRRARPQEWRTVEAPVGVGTGIGKEIGDADVVVIDCITLLVSNVIDRNSADPDRIDVGSVEEKLTIEISELTERVDASDASFIIVSNEVGMGLVPDNRLGRVYRDLLGAANQQLARHATEVYLMVSGIPMKVMADPHV